MTKKAKTILFFTLCIIFIAITPIVLFYSQGYRFDFENSKIVETGAILIKPYPRDASASVDIKNEKKVPSFSQAIFFPNVTPEEHSIVVKKDGYFTYEKEIKVSERLITEINAILFPLNVEKEISLESISEIYSISNNEFIIKKENEFLYFNPETNVTELITKDVFNTYEIINKSILAEKNNYYYLINNNQKQFLNIGQTDFIMDDRDNFYYKIDNKIYKNNELIKENIDFYNPPYYFTDGYLYKNDDKITDIPFKISPLKEYEILSINNNIFLNENNEKLYILDDNILDASQFKKVLLLNNTLEYDTYGDNTIFNTGNEIWIYFSEENAFNFITRFSYKIENIQWLNEYYFFFSNGNELIVSDADFENVITLLKYLNNPKAFLVGKTIYVLNNDNLYFVENIIP